MTCIPQTFGWCDSTWLLLDQLSILLGLIVLLLGFIGIPWAWVRRRQIVRRLLLNAQGLTSRLPKATDLKDDEWHWDGLVFTVSRAELPKWVLDLRADKLRAVALLATEQSQAAAQAIREHAQAKGIVHVSIEILPYPLDINDIEKHTELALKRLAERGVTCPAVDVTGGLVTMSLGAFKAAADAGVDTLYIAADWDRDAPKPRSVRQICVAPGRPGA